MSRADRFGGSLLVLIVAMWTIESASLCLGHGLNWLSGGFAVANIWSGVLIGCSVWRDRL